MLELKNVSKTYESKAGVIRALDNVSVSFGEKGLVFIVGKSGSGKSTFLNIAGGLDRADEGEIIIFGKSSKDFSEGDFDAYRNSFVGFVFQDSNVLPEFDVEGNVSLALRLRGGDKNSSHTRDILSDVGLSGFAKRKPSTLSGGERQRVGIARALVKDPKIIMADEPTGALDSKTGMKVMETLKELSLSRLVIVVSHDLHLAEMFADRVLELSDGRLVSDRCLSSRVVSSSGNVCFLGTDIFVRCGKDLSDEDFSCIREYVSSGEDGFAIRTDVRSFPETREVFESFEGGLDKKEEPSSFQEFKKSSFPAGAAFRMGASGLRLKPFRLAMTILLSFVAFVMFGLFSTLMLYDGGRVYARSVVSSGYEYVELTKYGNTYTDTYNVSTGAKYSYAVSSKTYFTTEEVGSFGDGAIGTFDMSFSPSNSRSRSSDYYHSVKISRAAYVPEGSSLRDKIFLGSYPEDPYEICVSSYVAESLMSFSYYPASIDAYGRVSMSDEPEDVQRMEDIIGKTLAYGDEAVLTISGVFDGGDIPSEYASLKEGYDSSLYSAFSDFIDDAKLLGTMFVSDAFRDEFRGMLVKDSRTFRYFDETSVYYRLTFEDGAASLRFGSTTSFSVYSSKKLHLDVRFFDGEKRDELSAEEIVIPFDWLSSGSAFSDWLDLVIFPDSDDYEGSESGEYARDLYEAELERDFILALVSSVKNGYFDEDSGRRYLTDEEIEASSALLDEFFTEYPLILTLGGYTGEPVGAYIVAGLYFDTAYSGVYLSDACYENLSVAVKYDFLGSFEQGDDAVYGSVLLPVSGMGTSSLRRYLTGLGVFDDLHLSDMTYVRLESSLWDEVTGVSDVVDMLSKVFLTAGLVLAVFAGLLLWNFISVSVTDKKKEIGLLRAVGAKSSDLYRIFFSESGIIVGACAVLSVASTSILCVVLNSFVCSSFGMIVSLFVFGWLPVFLILAIAAAVMVLGTIIPVARLARKNPADCMRE
ncbi:MAG: ATP-binding cassette domain-containing protein [Clostridia bacterium]|nr:ATP-binding cassette domain-containing protein [Clostridia bacterium]